MSTLKSIYANEGSEVLDRLSGKTGINRKYLYQIATGRRRPSAALALKLSLADPRLTLHELLLGESAHVTAGTVPAQEAQ